MYAGQLVEGGPSEAVTQEPKHPYTRLLLSAAPDPDRIAASAGSSANVSATNATKAVSAAPEAAEPPRSRGEIPSLITPPSGCRFHPRCPHAMPVCRERFPGRTDLGGGRWVHCFLYGDGEGVPSDPAGRSESGRG